MRAKRTYPRTACIIVTTEESLNGCSPSWRMYSSTWARWMPTSGSTRFPRTRQPTTAAVGTHGVGAPGVAGRVGHRSELGR